MALFDDWLVIKEAQKEDFVTEAATLAGLILELPRDDWQAAYLFAEMIVFDRRRTNEIK